MRRLDKARGKAAREEIDRREQPQKSFINEVFWPTAWRNQEPQQPLPQKQPLPGGKKTIGEVKKAIVAKHKLRILKFIQQCLPCRLANWDNALVPLNLVLRLAVAASRG